jgi:general stress protein 26
MRYLILIIVLLPVVAFSQYIPESQIKTTAREIMTAAKSCALITQSKDGSNRARTMDPFAPESDFTVWFGTKSNSRKVNQIKNEPRVTLYYWDADNTGYVTIQGTAKIINDSESKATWWKEKWNVFYPNKPKGYSLIKVTPNWMEVVSESRGILGDSINWKPQRVVFGIKR